MESKPVNNTMPNLYYDVLCGKLIIGEDAFEHHIETGGNPADVRPLPSLLVNPEISLPKVESDIDWQTESRQSYINFGGWLSSVVSLENVPINENIIKRATHLGLGPGRDQILHPDRFGSLSRFYIESNAAGTIRKGVFKTMDSSELAQQLVVIADELGHTPTWAELEDRSQKDPSSPHPRVLHDRFGSLTDATEFAGLKPYRLWAKRSEEDFVDWGVRFMIANNGIDITSGRLRYFAKQNMETQYIAPAFATTCNKFGKFNAYKARVREAYKDYLKAQKEHAEELLRLINERVSAGDWPQDGFDGLEEKEQTVLAAKLMVLDELLTNSLIETKLKIATGEYGGSFEYQIRKKNYAISYGEIESTALFLGVFDDIWPMEEYMQALKIPQEVIEQSRKFRPNDVDVADLASY